MVDGGETERKEAPDPPDSTLPSPGAEAAPEQASVDSFLRAAAHISEFGISEEPGLQGGHGRAIARGDLTAGAIIAKRYRLERELGRGGMGVVWEATHQVTRRRVAMKFVIGPAELRADLRRRFLREARAASAANHPNVVEVLDVFELDDGTPVMVMELLLGETLRERLVHERKLPLAVTASVLLPVAAAVGTAHSLGIVHRDLKPENIFLVAGADMAGGVKVLDFGVAKLLSTDGDAADTASLTGTGSALGTPCYMAPEQATGEKDIDARADIWAIGVIAYECLAGMRPVEGSGIGKVVMKLMTEGIKPIDQVVTDLPAEASALVMRMLARDRSERPQDLVEVQRVLAKFTSIEPRPFDAQSPPAIPGDEK
ncbi:MAG: serine/threonine-protein kinase, partial [Polyangiaceae bacterium]